MTSYTHTAADALHYAEIFEMRSKRREAINLYAEAKELDLYATALKFWAEHQPKFKAGDMIVYVYKDAPNFLMRVIEAKVLQPLRIDIDGSEVWRSSLDVFRLATAEEEAAGHRIDEVQDEQ